jgi:TonB family protein
MRVIVVDQDSTLLTALTQLLGEYFPIDAVTTKADCLDLVRCNQYDVVVASERLEDGSGLELLSQLARSRSDMLRVFAVEPERLKLLKGRLGPFGLFRTLSYPIEPRQLLAALSAAAGIEEEDDEEDLTAGVEVEFEAAPEASSAAAPRSAPAPAPLAPQLQTPTRVTAVLTAPVVSHSAAPAAAPPRSAPAPAPSRSAATPAAYAGRQPRQPTPEALALGARLAAASKPKGFAPPSLEASATRSAFVVAAGVVVVVGALILALRVFSPRTLHSLNLTNSSASFPPEVVKLVADTETAFQHQDLRAARTDIAALQQIAPTHPRLPFFETLLERSERAAADSRSSAPAKNMVPRQAVAKQRPPESQKTSPQRRIPAGLTTFSGKTVEDTTPGNVRPTDPASSFSRATAALTSSGSGAVTHEARVIQRVAAEYPDDAARDGVEGAVDLSFTISSRGDVHDVAVVHAEPSNIFNRNAIAAVRRWRYEPRTIDGIPVDARVQVRLTFKLNGEQAR